jgi:rhamnosyltransferase
MSTYNGEKYLSEQIDSLLRQIDVNVNVYIRDDGSKDSTLEILGKYAKLNKNIKIEYGENLGYAKSFWSMLKKDFDSDFYAFCDQDDIWEDNKLIEGINMIEKQDMNIPILYTSCVRSVNNDGKILSNNCFNTKKAINVYESFQRSIVPGCVFIFNKKAKEIMSLYNGCLESHDWAAYSIISAFGKVIYDERSFINYRIHGNNTIGKKNHFLELIKKIKTFAHKSICFRSRFATDFIECYSLLLENDIVKENIIQLAYYKDSFKNKLKLFANKNFKGIIFKCYVILGRV